MDAVIFLLLCYVSSAVYVEGDIETRVYNDSLNDQVRNIPEICVRRDGMLIQHSASPSFLVRIHSISIQVVFIGN